MRKSILVLAVILQASAGLFAQVTLTSGSYPISVTGTDSLKVTTASSAFPALAAMANGMWDMSIVTDSTPVLFAYRVPTTAYQFADSNFYSFTGYNYQGNVQTNITSAGILQYGISIQRTAYSIYPLTSGFTDSLIINGQNMVYSLPRTKIAFPATYSSSWSSVFRSDLDFQLTFLVAGDTLAPGIVRRYTTEKDSVTGWGKMRVLDATGTPSAYLNVLQVQTMIIHTDSFFLNGAPLSFILLTTLHLTQGQKDTVYEQNYYREQEVTPLAQVEFKDAAYTQPYKATTHVQRLQPSVSVANVKYSNEVKVYPNPVMGQVMCIELPPINGAWFYQLTDVNGRAVNSGLLQATGNHAALTLPSYIPPGSYYLSVKNNEQLVSIMPIEVIK